MVEVSATRVLICFLELRCKQGRSPKGQLPGIRVCTLSAPFLLCLVFVGKLAKRKQILLVYLKDFFLLIEFFPYAPGSTKPTEVSDSSPSVRFELKCAVYLRI